MAKIKTYDFNREENTLTVTYESGTVRKYSADRLPKTLQALVPEPSAYEPSTEENVPSKSAEHSDDESETVSPESSEPVSESEPKTDSTEDYVCERCSDCVRSPECLFRNTAESADCKGFSDKRRFDDVVFTDSNHKRRFLAVLCHMQAWNADPWRESLAYLITLDEVCRLHIDDIYDFKEGCIKPECLGSEWQTGTSIKTLLLAFNLFSNGTSWCPEYLNCYCTPDHIFNSTYGYYYFEAVKIMYHFPEPSSPSTPSEYTPETTSADEPSTEETTPAEETSSEVRKCQYCPECIYYERCTSTASNCTQCGSCIGACGVCCEHFVSRKSIDDIYEEQKKTEPAYEPEVNSDDWSDDWDDLPDYDRILDESDLPF